MGTRLSIYRHLAELFIQQCSRITPIETSVTAQPARLPEPSESVKTLAVIRYSSLARECRSALDAVVFIVMVAEGINIFCWCSVVT